jgi:CRISPR-associated protein Cas2
LANLSFTANTSAAAARWHIAYDIAQPRRLRRVERALSAVGERLHYSLFVCELTAAELEALQRRLLRLIEPAEDILRYTPLCAGDAQRMRHLGRPAPQLAVQADAWIV